ncbi:MAG TPA: dihydrodipicolinate synthase family protein [Gaiellales bacterium]|jgi:dihydrodipicolinate synthase/N-acetylneuraminate lyase|nr:dihydrodipicolinate synthase family protein [Gaiellales bacterium]
MPTPPPGVYPPLLTLYDDREEIDLAATAAFGRRLVDAGVHGLVLSGSTGEFHLHTPAERRALLEAVVAACPGTPVLAQVGAPAQRDAVALAKHAAANGAAGVMLITPYYNRVGAPELAGLARAVHAAVPGLPLIAYTMPAMAGSQWPLELLRELAAEGVVGGVKESADEVGRFLQILAACPPPFAAFCGTPPLLIPAVLAGGHGGILAIANAVPERCVAVYEAAAAGEGRRAAELFAPLVRLIGAVRAAGAAPTGLRAAAALRFGIGTATRRPLAPVADDSAIRAVLDSAV